MNEGIILAGLLLLVVLVLSPVVVVAGATIGFMVASGLWH